MKTYLLFSVFSFVFWIEFFPTTFLPHTGTSVDDTVFAPTGASSLLVVDTSGATEGVVLPDSDKSE